MNHRDRNVHNAGFTCGGYSHGYKPKATIDGVKLTMLIITLTIVLCIGGKLVSLL